jgi:hypothetical protein
MMRALPKGSQDSALAQSVEQMTVNHWVAGSSPAGGAKILKGRTSGLFFAHTLRVSYVQNQ